MDAQTPMADRERLLETLDRTMRAASAQRVLYSHALAERLGLLQTDLECLYIITLSTDVTPGHLAQETGLTTGAITGVVDRIERAGYVRRERDPADRRRVLLRPVMSRVEEIRRVNREMRDLWMAELIGYSPEELAFLIDFARRNYRSAVAATARMRGPRRGRGGRARGATVAAGPAGRGTAPPA